MIKNRKVFRYLALSALFSLFMSASLPPITTDAGRRQWRDLEKDFKKSKDPKLVVKAFKGETKGQKSAIEKAIALFDLLAIAPKEFITGAVKYDKSFNCPIQILVPRTQFIPFKEVETHLKRAENSKDALAFRKKARSYYQFIKDKKLPTDEFKCSPAH